MMYGWTIMGKPVHIILPAIANTSFDRFEVQIGETLVDGALTFIDGDIPYRRWPNHCVSLYNRNIYIGDRQHHEKFPALVSRVAHKCLQDAFLKSIKDEGSFRLYPLPIYVITDKDKSKFRERLVTVLRVASLDDDMTLPLFSASYLGHPANVNQSGLGIATDIICLLKKFGFREAELKSHIKGAAYDGQMLHNNVLKHIYKELGVVRDMTRESLQMWDGSHLLELVLLHALEPPQFRGISDTRLLIQNVTTFFRENREYEILLNTCTVMGRQLYSPKYVKDLKFVGHSSTLINDFIWNMETYVQTLYKIKHNVSMKADTRARCEGYLNKITDPLFKLNLYFLKSVCGVLKKFSYQLQKSDTCINDYTNTIGCLKHVLSSIDITGASTSAGTQYYFKDYFEPRTRLPFHLQVRSSRSTPNFGTVASQQLRQQQVDNAVHTHQQLFKSLLEQFNQYWWQNNRWWSSTQSIAESAGGLLNHLQAHLGLPTYRDPTKPLEGRCSVCAELVMPDNPAPYGVEKKSLNTYHDLIWGTKCGGFRKKIPYFRSQVI